MKILLVSVVVFAAPVGDQPSRETEHKVRSLIQSMADDNAEARQQAVRALAGPQFSDEQVLPALLKALTAENLLVRQGASQALCDRLDADFIRTDVDTGIRTSKHTLSSLANALKDDDGTVRANCAAALGAMGPQAKDSVPRLKERLEDPSAEVRVAVAGALWSIQRGGEETLLPVLVAALAEDSMLVRHRAASTLARMRGAAKDAVKPLRRALNDRAQNIRLIAAHALWEIDRQPALGVVVECLNNPFNRPVALAILKSMGRAAAPAIKPVEKLLDDEDQSVRVAAALTLWRIDRQTRNTAPILVEAWLAPQPPKAPDPLAQALVSMQLMSFFRGSGAAAAPALAAALKNEHARTRAQAASALALLEEDCRLARPALLAALNDSDKTVRRNAAHALSYLGAEGELAVTALVEGMEITNENFVRYDSALGLGRIGPKAKQAVAPLLAMAREDVLLRSAAVEALGQIGPDARAALPALKEFMKHRDPWLQAHAAVAWFRVMPEPEKVVPFLVKMLDDKEKRLAGLFALAAVGPAAEMAVPAILEVLEHDGARRQDALEALAAIGPVARPALRDLKRILQDPKGVLDIRVAAAIVEIAGADQQIVAGLGLALSNEDESIRLGAARTLARIGPQARSTLPALEKALYDSSDEVRRVARYAIRKIDPALGNRLAP